MIDRIFASFSYLSHKLKKENLAPLLRKIVKWDFLKIIQPHDF